MKKIQFWLLAIFTVFFLAQCNNADTEENNDNSNSAEEEVSSDETTTDNETADEIEVASGDAKYQIESGIITYDYDIAGMNTETTIYFDDYGAREVIESKNNMMGANMHSRVFFDDEYVYTLEMNTKTAVKSALTDDDEIPDDVENKPMDFSGMFEDLEGDPNTTALPDEEVAGKMCKVYEFTDETDGTEGKVWIWKGLLMKMELAGQMPVKVEVTNLEENADIPEDLFVIPEGFTVKEVNF